MSMEEADAEKKAEMPELDLWGSGRNPRGHRSKRASNATVATGTKSAAGEATMEAVVARSSHASARGRGIKEIVLPLIRIGRGQWLIIRSQKQL